MAENANIRLLQVTVRVGGESDFFEVQIKAGEDAGANPALAPYGASGIDDEIVELFEEVIRQLKSAHKFKKRPFTLLIDDLKRIQPRGA